MPEFWSHFRRRIFCKFFENVKALYFANYYSSGCTLPELEGMMYCLYSAPAKQHLLVRCPPFLHFEIKLDKSLIYFGEIFKYFTAVFQIWSWIQIYKIRKVLGLHDTDLYPSINKQKTIGKNLDSTVLWLLNDLLSLKTDANVPTVRSKKSKNFF